MTAHHWRVTMWFRGADRELIESVTEDVADNIARRIQPIRTVQSLVLPSRQEGSVSFLAEPDEMVNIEWVVARLLDGKCQHYILKPQGVPTHV